MTNRPSDTEPAPAPKPTLLEQFDEATASVNQDRAPTYGDPRVNFSRIDALHDVVSECHDPAARVALNMICVKIARLIQSPDHLDSWVDIAGYARTGVMCLADPVPAPKPVPTSRSAHCEGGPLDGLTVSRRGDEFTDDRAAGKYVWSPILLAWCWWPE